MPYKTAHLYLNQGKRKFSQQCRGKLLCSPILWCCRTHYVQVSKAFAKVSWPGVCTHPTLRNAIFKLNYSQCITKASEPLMGGCFHDRVSPIFILSGIWDIFLVRPAICCVKMLPISLCCMKIAFHTALAVQALAVKVLSPTALLRSLTERWVVLPCRQFEGAAVFPADRDDTRDCHCLTLFSMYNINVQNCPFALLQLQLLLHSHPFQQSDSVAV